MSRISEYRRGYQDGVRAAATWLSARAKEMNDPHAVRILDSAATNLGWDHKHGRLPLRAPDRIDTPPAPNPRKQEADAEAAEATKKPATDDRAG